MENSILMTFNTSYLVRMNKHHEKYVFLDLILHTILILMNCTKVKIMKNIRLHTVVITHIY